MSRHLLCLRHLLLDHRHDGRMDTHARKLGHGRVEYIFPLSKTERNLIRAFAGVMFVILIVLVIFSWSLR